MQDINPKQSKQQNERIKELELQIELEKLRHKDAYEVDEPKAKSVRPALKVLLVVVLILVGLLVGLIILASAMGNKSSSKAASENSNSAQQTPSQEAQLAQCINDVEDWWSKNATTVGMALTLLDQKKQQVGECQTKYPVTAAASNQSQYQGCLIVVDDWWSKNATTVIVANMMLPVKQQMIDECKVSFPV